MKLGERKRRRGVRTSVKNVTEEDIVLTVVLRIGRLGMLIVTFVRDLGNTGTFVVQY